MSLEVAADGATSFLIDAPLEKIKGKTSRAQGKLQLDPARLDKTSGQLDVDLTTLETFTFDDAGKNAKQTEHVHNWLELGADVEEKQRKENRWARFTIRGVELNGPKELAKIPEKDGKRTVEVVGKGDLWLHGVSVPKSVALTVEVHGPADAPTAAAIKTREPLLISMKEHDVKPRDIAGKFLQGALEQVGQKIDDQIQISVDLRATSTAQTAAHP